MGLLDVFRSPIVESLDEFDEKTRSRLDRMLADDESFEVAVIERDALLGQHRTRVVLTDRRLIELDFGFVFDTDETIELAKVSSVETDRGGFVVEVDGTGVDDEWQLSSGEQGRRFADAIRSKLRDTTA
jgi:hypothetical protein